MKKKNKKIFFTSKDKAQMKVYLSDRKEGADILGVVVHTEAAADLKVYVTGIAEAERNVYIVKNSRKSKNEGA